MCKNICKNMCHYMCTYAFSSEPYCTFFMLLCWQIVEVHSTFSTVIVIIGVNVYVHVCVYMCVCTCVCVYVVAPYSLELNVKRDCEPQW